MVADNCKFAHIRETYKTGWVLEKEFEEEQRKKNMQLMLGKSLCCTLA